LKLEDLKKMITKEAEAVGLEPRNWQPHPNCRSTMVRVF
jgi:hypothetical protein